MQLSYLGKAGREGSPQQAQHHATVHCWCTLSPIQAVRLSKRKPACRCCLQAGLGHGRVSLHHGLQGLCLADSASFPRLNMNCVQDTTQEAAQQHQQTSFTQSGVHGSACLAAFARKGLCPEAAISTVWETMAMPASHLVSSWGSKDRLALLTNEPARFGFDPKICISRS